MFGRIYLRDLKSLTFQRKLFQRVPCCELHNRARLKLERIYKKKQQDVVRSKEALRKLRRKKLEGLSVNTVPRDVQLAKTLSNAREIRRLLYIYSTNKQAEEFTLSNKVVTLRRIAELFEGRREERLVLHKKYYHQKLIGEVIESVADSYEECNPRELVDVVVAFSRLHVKQRLIYAPFLKEIHKLDLKGFSSEDITSIYWTLGVTENTTASELMKEVELELSLREFITFTSSDLSRIAWALVNQNSSADRLFNGICTELLSRDVSLFEPKMISLICLTFSRVDLLADRVLLALEQALYPVIEAKKFPTEDLVSLTVSFLRHNNITVKMFRKLDKLLVSRRDFEEVVSRELLEELLSLLRGSPFHLAETRKIIENVLYPQSINSIFDIFYRPRRSWKSKIFKQSWFKVY